MKIIPSLSATAVLAVISLPDATTAFGLAPATTSAHRRQPVVALGAASVDDSAATAAATAADENPRLSGLALALDDGTRKSHSMAENTAFVQGFFKGISSADSYRNLLTSLYYVYRAMEVDVMDAVAAAAQADDDDDGAKWVAALDVAPLRRLDGLEKDMEYFYGPDWKTTMTPPTKNTVAYVNRIRELAASITTTSTGEENDETDGSSSSSETKEESLLYLFVAHQYTRYLGDLFGGQMMGSMASRSMDLPGDGSGIQFYTFEDVPSKKDFITEWYSTLNGLGVSPERQAAIVDEANLVFGLNIGILEELEGSPWQAVWTMALSGWTNIKESKNGGSSI